MAPKKKTQPVRTTPNTATEHMMSAKEAEAMMGSKPMRKAMMDGMKRGPKMPKGR